MMKWMLLLLLVAMYRETLVELPIGLIDGLLCWSWYHWSSCDTALLCWSAGAGKSLWRCSYLLSRDCCSWRKQRRNYSCWDLGELQMLKAIVVVVAISNRYGWTATKTLLRKSAKLLLLMLLNPPHHLYYCLQVLLLTPLQKSENRRKWQSLLLSLY